MRYSSLALTCITLLSTTSCRQPTPHYSMQCSTIGQHQPLLVRFDNQVANNKTKFTKEYDQLCSEFCNQLIKIGFAPTPAFSYEPNCITVTLKDLSHEAHSGIQTASDTEFLLVHVEGNIDHRHFSKNYRCIAVELADVTNDEIVHQIHNQMVLPSEACDHIFGDHTFIEYLRSAEL